MGDNKKKWLWISLGIVAGILVLGYIGTALYFMSHFLPNTKVNGKDFSYAKGEDVADYLKSEVNKYELKITEHAGLSDMITGKEISVEYKENGVIDKLLKEQSVFLWPAAWSGEGKGLSITASADYDEKALDAKIASLTAMTTEQVQPISSMPVFNGEKFVPGDITEGTAIDADALKKAVVQAIEGLQEQLNLDEAGCYVQPPYTKESLEVQQACDAMNAYLNASVTYEMGLDTPVVVDKTIISQWVTADENYVVTFHPELIQEWVTQFAQQYDTAGKTRQFTTPDGRATEVSGGTYGWEINEKAEYETLLANVESRRNNKSRAGLCGRKDCGIAWCAGLGLHLCRSRSDESENVVCQRRRSFNVSRCSDRTSERRKKYSGQEFIRFWNECRIKYCAVI